MDYDTLVLSGGGLNGIVMLGSLQSCSDNKLLEKINTFVGTSVGSIICYLLIIGYTPIEIIVNLCKNTGLFEKLSHLDVSAIIRGEGAISFNVISQYLEAMTIDKIGKLITMEEIRNTYGKNLICVSYNITKNKAEYISCEKFPNLSCIQALRMSCSIPFIFDHCKYENDYYTDGGIFDAFPLDIGQKNGTRVLGICLCASFLSSKTVSPETNILEYILRIFRICLDTNSIKSIDIKNETTKLILLKNYEHQSISTFSVASRTKLELFSAGYEETKNIML